MNAPDRRRGGGDSAIGVEPIRVLVVDDDPHYLAYLSALVKGLGLYVETAADGIDALKRLRASHFDLLLSDYGMPNLDGVGLITEVRADESIGSLYAVMLTAHDTVTLKVRALSSGYDDFLPKGCTEVEVIARVAAARRLLARQHLLDDAVRQWKGIASQDALTGVSNRRFFFDETARRLEEKHPVGIVLFDLDDFKVVNDRYGHLTGDRILQDIGALFLRSTRQVDLIARYGGDEFVLVVSDISLDEARTAAERLAREIASLSWTAAGEVITVTSSVGVGLSSLIPDPTPEKILEAADRELYAQKWLRKHPPAAADELYEYPRGEKPAEVIRLDVPPAQPDAGTDEKVH